MLLLPVSSFACSISLIPWRDAIGLICRFTASREGTLKPMDAEQLREYGHKMVDFIADYYKSIESFPVLSQVKV